MEWLALVERAGWLGERLSRLELTLAVAESCTGGLLSAALTEIPGSSQWYVGGVVAYANSVKDAVLAVPNEVLAEHGAVSEQTAQAMADGVRRLLKSDIAVGVTGIAGPTGGSAIKPVGTVCLGFRLGERLWAETRHFEGDRASVRRASAARALSVLLDNLS